LGEAVVGGHLVDITDWFNEKVKKEDFYDTFISSFCEYPDGSGKYYGVPALGDFFGMSYRTDLFNDPEEKKAFQEKYGYELKVPETWSQLRDIAEFFTRPEKNLSGVALWQAPIPTAGLTDEFLACFWSFGAELWDPATKKVKGYLNSEAGKAAARYWVDLYKFCPPGSANYSMDEANTAMQQGLVAMMGTYLAFYPGLVDPDLSAYWDKIDFFPTPKEKDWYVQLGGQGLSISAYTPHKKEALMFLEWWLRPETQWKWAQAGMFSCMKPVVEDDKYLECAPVNKVARASYPHLKDYWEIPQYNEMGTVMAEILNAAVLGKYTPDEAMDLIAEKHEEILERAGYYK
jgi:multiple sugar transport system substrate-binding protein